MCQIWCFFVLSFLYKIPNVSISHTHVNCCVLNQTQILLTRRFTDKHCCAVASSTICVCLNASRTVKSSVVTCKYSILWYTLCLNTFGNILICLHFDCNLISVTFETIFKTLLNRVFLKYDFDIYRHAYQIHFTRYKNQCISLWLEHYNLIWPDCVCRYRSLTSLLLIIGLHFSSVWNFLQITMF